MVKKRKKAMASKTAVTSRPVAAAAADAAADDAGDVASDAESSDDEAAARGQAEGEDDDFFETPDEKRVRLAKDYLTSLGGDPADKVQDRLTKDVVEQERRARAQIQDLKLGEPRFLRGHREAATCICLSQDESNMFTGSKDCKILRWDVETGTKVSFLGGRNKFECGGHFEHVLGVSLMEQRNLLVSVGADHLVRLWDPRCDPQSACTAELYGHMGVVSSVVAEPDGSRVYTGSYDKSVKIWDLASRRCVDTLFGHVQGVTDMDIYHKGRPVTGGTDKTVRAWKVDKDTHLMFSKHTYAVDAVSVLDQERLLSGSQDGSVLLWSHASKKPLAAASVGSGNWVTALGTIKGADVAFSGSTDRKLRTWRVVHSQSEDKGSKKGALTFAEGAATVETPGIVNGIAVGQRILACAIGKEHKFGAWFHEKKTRNGVLLVPLSYTKS